MANKKCWVVMYRQEYESSVIQDIFEDKEDAIKNVILLAHEHNCNELQKEKEFGENPELMSHAKDSEDFTFETKDLGTGYTAYEYDLK